MQSEPIITDVVMSNLDRARCTTTTTLCDKVFLRVLRFSPPIKLTATI